MQSQDKHRKKGTLGLRSNRSGMSSSPTHRVKRLLGLLAMMGMLAGCGGGKVGTPLTPPLGTSQAVRTQQDALSSATSLAGTWTGTLSQVQNPTSYSFTIDAQASGDTLSGTSRIEQGAYYGVMSFTATVSQGVVQYSETAILEQNPPPDTHWCLKSGALTLSNNNTEMSGDWNDPGCNSGNVVLNLVAPSPSPTAPPTPTPTPIETPAETPTPTSSSGFPIPPCTTNSTQLGVSATFGVMSRNVQEICQGPKFAGNMPPLPPLPPFPGGPPVDVPGSGPPLPTPTGGNGGGNGRGRGRGLGLGISLHGQYF